MVRYLFYLVVRIEKKKPFLRNKKIFFKSTRVPISNLSSLALLGRFFFSSVHQVEKIIEQNSVFCNFQQVFNKQIK